MQARERCSRLHVCSGRRGPGGRGKPCMIGGNQQERVHSFDAVGYVVALRCVAFLMQSLWLHDGHPGGAGMGAAMKGDEARVHAPGVLIDAGVLQLGPAVAAEENTTAGTLQFCLVVGGFASDRPSWVERVVGMGCLCMPGVLVAGALYMQPAAVGQVESLQLTLLTHPCMWTRTSGRNPRDAAASAASMPWCLAMCTWVCRRTGVDRAPISVEF